MWLRLIRKRKLPRKNKIYSNLSERHFSVKYPKITRIQWIDSRIRDGRGRGCFWLRLRNIRQSNKPVIQLKAIRKMNNSFHSDNFIFLINAASQVLTLSNIPAQSPSAFPLRPSRKVHQKGCIRLIFCVHPIGSISPICKYGFFKTAHTRSRMRS